MHLSLCLTPKRLAVALTLTLIGVALAGLALLDNAHAHPGSEDPTVRVSALKSDDGSVSVSLQTLGADGEWGERLLPTSRVIPTDAPIDTWLRSSRVDLGGAGDPAPLFCVVAHGAPDDRFWVKFRAYLYQSAALTDTNLRFETYLDGADQAAALDRCLADGAAVVASTLASPDAVRETLLKAREAEVRVVTFNAGVRARRRRRLPGPHRPQRPRRRRTRRPPVQPERRHRSGRLPDPRAGQPQPRASLRRARGNLRRSRRHPRPARRNRLA